jgi:UDP-N-acetylglucosamine--N-acetylmuramyl-(pentapeptide) pyrophosphoryl-undecaprenol N-acetylglucosamine transferase
VVIAGGGTAGHVAPGLAIAEAVRRRAPDARVSFIGTRRGLEGDVVAAAGYRLHLINVIPWARTMGARRFLAPIALVRATAQARAILRRERVSVVVGMGGYASLPAVAAARLGRVPALLQEQNAVPGLANVVGARLTPHVALGFEEAAGAFPRSARPRVTGVPLRPRIATADLATLREEARRAFGLDAGRATLLVVGGSLGAARLNALALDLGRRWAGRGDRQVLLVAGRGNIEGVEAEARAAGALPLRAVAFVERMELAYAAADLALARAGASTVAELAILGLPAVLVPYPYARRREQDANAHVLAHAGGAVVLADADASPERVSAQVEELLRDAERRRRMAAAARAAGKPGAADEIAAWALELAAGGGGRD